MTMTTMKRLGRMAAWQPIVILICLIAVLPQQMEANQISTPKTSLSVSGDGGRREQQQSATSQEAQEMTTRRSKNVKVMDLSSPFLPDNLPDGDPVHYALPVFLDEPEDTFVVKNKAAELECRVAHAHSVYVQCQDEIQHGAVTEDHVDPETGIRITEARWRISRDQVEEYFGEYHCGCVAASGKGHVKSRLALVTVAFLKKTFETPPYSHQSLEGKQLELRCYPPRGKPDPEIHWLKGDQLVDESDSNYVVTHEGHLIIVNPRLSDSGNFTCVARNIAAERRSAPAEITIYVSGGWSSWSSWSGCNGPCGKGIKKRSRVCDNPMTLHGSQAKCPGQATQTKKCDSDCIGTHGGWSSWSSWSSCTEDCRQSRTRSCDDPAPSNGGHFCFGLDEDSQECSEDACPASRAVWVEQSSDAGSVTSVTSSEIALYVGLSLAVVVFLVVVLVGLSLLRRRRLPSGYRLTQSAYEAEQRKKMYGAYAGGGGGSEMISPGTTELTSVCYEYSYPDPNCNVKSRDAGIYSIGKNVSEHHYEQPMVIMPSRSPVDSIVKPLISDTSSSSTGGNISPRSAGTFDRSPAPNTQPLSASTPLPRSGQLSETVFTKWASVTSAGARILLSESSISLTIPEGALPPGQTQDMYISVVHDTKSYPEMTHGQTLLSPVIICGPVQATKKLRKPVIVSLPHCAALRQGNWTLSVLGACEDKSEAMSWRSLVTLGQENINSPVYAQLDLNMVHLMTENLTALALVGQSSHTAPAFKSLRIAAFAQEYPQGSDLTVRLYCLQDTDHAVKFVTETERQFGGRLLDKPVSTVLMYGGHNMRLKLERLGEGWTVGAGAEVQEVPFSHLWGNSNPNLHCSFTLRAAMPGVRQLGMQVSIGQEGNTNKCLLKINSNISSNGSNNSGNREYKMRPSSSGCSSNDSYGSGSGTFRLPSSTKETLTRMLDAPVSLGNDWRMLAERLNVHRYIAFFATRPSPTEAILNLWEARNRETNATQGLLNILRGMGRFDAAHLLEHDLQLT